MTDDVINLEDFSLSDWTIQLNNRVITSFCIKEGERLVIGRGADAVVVGMFDQAHLGDKVRHVDQFLRGAPPGQHQFDRFVAVLDKPAEGRGKYFDSLRKNYPVRREFKNTSVIVKDTNSRLAKKLMGIGFKEVKGEK